MGYYIYEGIDGSGKDSQADLLVQHLGESCLRLNEPDATLPTGKLLRECLASGAHPKAHAAMFLADRMALHHAKIGPAQAEGRDVVCSRSFLSTLAYQQEQWSGDEGLQWLFDIHRMLPCKADIIFILDVDSAEGLARVNKRDISTEYYEKMDFQVKNRQRYLDLAIDPRMRQFLTQTGRVVVLNTQNKTVGQIHGDVLKAIAGEL